MKKILALVLALAMVFALAACGSQAKPAATPAPTAAAEPVTPEPTAEPTPEPTAEPAPEPTEAPAEAPTEEPAAPAVMSYADYVAAALDTEVTVETYVQAKQSWWEDKATVYTQDEDGAYFLYNMNCSQEDYDKLVPGTKIRVTGFKSEWAGEVEITDASFEIVESDAFLAEPKDVTAQLGSDALLESQNQLVSFQGMTVEAYDETGAAFAYKNAENKTDDLYFKVSKDGQTYEFCVEYYLCNEETEVYQAVENLNVGDVVDLVGFLYWYEGPNPHITSVTVVTPAPVVETALAVEDVPAAAPEEEAAVEQGPEAAIETAAAAAVLEGAPGSDGDGSLVEAEHGPASEAAEGSEDSGFIVSDLGPAGEASEEPAAEEPAAEEAPAEEPAAEEPAAEEEAPAEEPVVLSFADYAAAELDTEVTVETYVQAKQSWWEDKATFYCQSEDGAYFLYNMNCSQEDYDKLVPGTKIRVTGFKSEWAGEVEITDAAFEILEAEAYIAEPVDVTALLGSEELIEHQNQLVAFQGMTVEAYDEEGNAFAYKNAENKTDDLYFKVSKDGQTYEFCVEYYLCNEETAVYQTVEGLNVGDVVDLVGFLYWYEGPNPHITAVLPVATEEAPAEEAVAEEAPAEEPVAEEAPAEEPAAEEPAAEDAAAVKEPVAEAAAIMSYADYAAAELDTEVTVETYVQAKQSWWEDKATFYCQSEDGAYFLYNMPCSEEEYELLVPGTKIRVTGYKSEWAGEVEITDAAFEILEAEPFIAEPVDVTALLGDDALIEHQNQLVAFQGMTVEPYDEEGNAFAYKNAENKTDDLYFKVSKDGQTYEFCVEYYLCNEETAVYQTVEGLNVGDVVDLVGFLYWYEGPNPHITAVLPVATEEAPAEEPAAEEAPAEEAPAEEAPAEEAPAEEEPAAEAAAIMSYADYAAAELDTEVTVETFVQAKQSWWEDKATFYCQSEDGAYFLYNMPCSEEEYELLVPGTKIRVTGYKSEWAGEVEITDAVFEIQEADEPFIAEPVDVTALLGSEELIEHQNQLVVFDGMTVEPYDEEGNAFAYKNPENQTDDLYFKVSKDGQTYEFCVEYYLCNEETEVYQAVQNFQVGDSVRLVGFLYWYEGPNPHITAVSFG